MAVAVTMTMVVKAGEKNVWFCEEDGTGDAAAGSDGFRYFGDGRCDG